MFRNLFETCWSMNFYVVYDFFMIAFALCFVLLKRNTLGKPGFAILSKCPRLLKMLGKL